MKKILVLILIGFVSLAFAKDDANDLLKDVQKTYKSNKDLSIHFTQKFLWKLTKEEITIAGKIFVQDGEKFRFENPDNLIINDGKALYTLSYANNQVIVNDAKQGGDQPFLKSFIEKYVTDYNAEWVEEKSGIVHLHLTAKSQDEFVRQVHLWVNKDSKLINKVLQIDANENETTYIVDSVDLDTKLTADDFKISNMDQYELIDLR